MRATCSAASVSSATGLTAARVASRASASAAAMPSSTITPSPKRSVASVEFTSPIGRATCMTAPFGSFVVKHAHLAAGALDVGEERAALAVGDLLERLRGHERGGLLAERGRAPCRPG